MPQYHNWFQSVTIGNAARRQRDRQRKCNARGLRGEQLPNLADYMTIDRCIYQRRNIGGHIVGFYTLRGIAEIFNLAPATVQRWFDLYMLPTPAQWEILGNAGETTYAYADNTRKRPLYSK
jgi:formylglycine-generating enzyme required for sulfatase activity